VRLWLACVSPFSKSRFSYYNTASEGWEVKGEENMPVADYKTYSEALEPPFMEAAVKKGHYW